MSSIITLYLICLVPERAKSACLINNCRIEFICVGPKFRSINLLADNYRRSEFLASQVDMEDRRIVGQEHFTESQRKTPGIFLNAELMSYIVPN